MYTEFIWQATLSLFSDLFIKIANWTLSTLMYLFCLEIHWKSIGSPLEVQQTGDLASITGFCLCPSEIRRKSGGSPADIQRTQNPASPTISCFRVAWADFHWTLPGLGWTNSGIQPDPMDSDGLPMDCPLGPSEMAGSDESPSESVGKAVGV